MVLDNKSAVAWTSGAHTALPVSTTSFGSQSEIFNGNYRQHRHLEAAERSGQINGVRKKRRSDVDNFRRALRGRFLLLPSVERESEGTKERAVVLSVDNANIMSVGLLKQGEQKLEVEVQSGKFKGEKFAAMNVLRAQMDLDKIFEVGDEALVGIPHGATPQGTTINAQDHYRTGWTFARWESSRCCCSRMPAQSA